MPKRSKPKPAKKSQQTAPYKHPESQSLMRPEVGTQAQFKKKKAPKTYQYDSSLSPALDWDAKNPAVSKPLHVAVAVRASRGSRPPAHQL
jgi:adenine-specific DNA-methyltransferase